MKQICLVLAVALAPLFALALPTSIDLIGIYKSGCILCRDAATLNLQFEEEKVQVTLKAGAESCVLSFATGSYAGSYKSIDSYTLPIADNCGRQNVFGPNLRLALTLSTDGEVKSAKILGERSSHRLGWEYFSGQVR